MKKIQAILTNEHSVSDLKLDEWFDSIKDEPVVYFSTQSQIIKLRLENLKGNINIDSFVIGEYICYVQENHHLDYFPEEAFCHSLNLAKETAKLYMNKDNQKDNSLKETIAVFDNECSIADADYNEWFESVKNQDVIKYSTNVQFLKLRLEHVKQNINIKHFDFFDNIISILDNGNLQGNSSVLPDVSFSLVKEFMKIQKEKFN